VFAGLEAMLKSPVDYFHLRLNRLNRLNRNDGRLHWLDGVE
jgi:hypothetical protein